MEKLQEQDSNAFLEESGRISIHQNKRGHAFQLLHLYGDWTSGKIWCQEKKTTVFALEMLLWRFLPACPPGGESCIRWKGSRTSTKTQRMSWGAKWSICGGSLLSTHGSARGMKVRLQIKFLFTFYKVISNAAILPPDWVSPASLTDFLKKRIVLSVLSLLSCCMKDINE